MRIKINTGKHNNHKIRIGEENEDVDEELATQQNYDETIRDAYIQQQPKENAP